MATTTTNFGWDIPQSTDLVKDGATAIAALGQDIDTALVDLKGGTTGQVLAKASATDLDYSWVTTDDTNAIQNAIVDAKGDLIAASAADTPARLAVGDNGEILVADSSTATGLRWQSSNAAGKNVVINGGFDVWQRGTSFTGVASGTYTTDRWKTTLTATGLSCNVTQDASVPNSKSKYSIKVLQATSATSVGEYEVRTAFETSQILPLCGSTTTLSFWYRSNLTGAHAARLYASPMTGGTDVSISFTVSAANTWEKKVLTFSSFAGVTTASTAPTAEAAGLSIGFNVFGSASRSTLAANDFFQVAQVQLEVGSVNTSFTRASGNISTELAACQRYYYRSTAATNSWVLPMCVSATSTTAGIYAFALPVTMRTSPTSVDSSAIQLVDGISGFAVTSILISNASPAVAYGTLAVASGLTTRAPYSINSTGAAGYVGFSAEL
jgi:hypothetical protein